MSQAVRFKTAQGEFICDVEFSDAQWADFKREARRKKMKLAEWIHYALHEGLKLLEERQPDDLDRWIEERGLKV